MVQLEKRKEKKRKKASICKFYRIARGIHVRRSLELCRYCEEYRSLGMNSESSNRRTGSRYIINLSLGKSNHFHYLRALVVT